MDWPALKRILGYTDKLTVRPGELIDFKISLSEEGAYSAQLVRPINGDIYSTAAGFKEIEIDSSINGEYQGRRQAVAPGSCIIIDSVKPLDRYCEWTLVLNVFPTTPTHGLQHLIDRWNVGTQRGWSLHLNEKGCLRFISADDSGNVSSCSVERSLERNVWYSVGLRVSLKRRTAQLEVREIRTTPHKLTTWEARALIETLGGLPQVSFPLLMAAAMNGRDAAGRVIPVECFNGRLEAPVLYEGVLSDDEFERVRAGERPESARVIADWDFSEGISGIEIKDRSRHALCGSTHNLPLRGVKGSRWNGTVFDWPQAPGQYGAIHFHSDDLYDCGWQTDIRYRIPDDLHNGIYALRLRRAAFDGARDEDYLPFFVAAPKGAAKARIAFLVPTHTYVAYGNFHALEPARRECGQSETEFYAQALMGPGTREFAKAADAHAELGFSLYDRHIDGSPVHFSSWLRPLLNMRPKSLLWTLCADLLSIDWLETQGFDYDVITDDLVQREGAERLKDYRVILTGNHPEYCTTAQMDAMESYLRSGGRLMYLGGNGFYWRAAVHPSLPAAIEIRRGRVGTGMWQSEVGESALSLTGERGGIWRELGRPPQRLVGVGFTAEGWGASRYRVLPGVRESRAGFILEGVEGDIIGDFGLFEGAAAGQEIDRTNAAHGTPAHAVVVARSEQHGPGMLYAIEEMTPTYPVIEAYRDATCAEIVFFETPGGGAVFAVGSMAWCGSLGHNGHDNNVSRITANVLNRFLLEKLP